MDKEIKNKLFLAPAAQLDLVKTFECGQCFRWEQDESSVYKGVAHGKARSIWRDGEGIFCDAPESDLSIWRNYLDLETDYDCPAAVFTEPEYLKTCAEYGKGIRILRQEPWEALCSFIISQCNNIPRIKQIIGTLCRLYGEKLDDDIYSFPDARTIAALSESELAPLRCGYRAPYILSAARAVCEGSLDFDALAAMPADDAFTELKRLQGVGSKVASCFMLYGLHRMDSFPIDTWMKKALDRHFPKDYDPAVLGSFAGLAQQYIFFYARTNEEW